MNMNNPKTLVSGVQPSGSLHLGNYFGAMQQFVQMQDEYNAYILIADYHSLSVIRDPDELRRNIKEIILDYLALGIDPEKLVLYQQSSVPQVTELAWIFNCLITVPYLSRAHAYKDKVANNIEPSVGLFDYPVLQAADILIMDADIVPVGRDQEQHLEITRDIAQKFNNTFGEAFRLPETKILDEVAIVPGTDGRKMSKSYQNTIPLFADDDKYRKAVMEIVTDSKTPQERKNPDQCTVFALHKLFSTPSELAEIRAGYENGGLGYGESKEILVKNITSFFAEMNDRRKYFENNPDLVSEIIASSGSRAYETAESKMQIIRKMVGLR